MATQRRSAFSLSVYTASGATDMYSAASELLRHSYAPASGSGQWITYPDGSRFRKATDYARSSLIFHEGNAEDSLVRSTVTGSFKRVKTSPGGFTAGNYTTPSWTGRLSGGMGIANIERNPSFVTMESNEATTKALNELADQKANLGENLATLRQTIRLFSNPVGALLKGLQTMKRDKSMAPYLAKSFHELVRSGIDKKIASKYLEYVYGFKPLMQDIYSLSEFAKENSNKPLLLNARGKSLRKLSVSDQISVNPSERRKQYWSNITGKSRTSVSLWARIDPNYNGTRTLNQLGLINPASLVWELVPYSFVVDWFLPIGPVLNALTAPAGLIFVDGSVSRRVSAHWDTSDHRYYNTEAPVNISAATGAFEYEGYTRSRLSSWPRPGLWFDQDPLGLQSSRGDRSYKALAVAIMSLR